MKIRLPLILAFGLAMGAIGYLVGSWAKNSQSTGDGSSTSIQETRTATQGRANAKTAEANPAVVVAPGTVSGANIESSLRAIRSASWRKKWLLIRDLARSIAPGEEINAL